MLSIRTTVVLALLASSALAGDAPLDATTRDFDQISLLLEIEPDLEKRTVEGKATIRFAALVDNFRRLRLHSLDTTVVTVTDSKGRGLVHATKDGILGIELASPLSKGIEESVRIHYRSKPTSGLWFHGPTKKHPQVPLSVYSQGQGTNNRHWIPCYDEPDDRLTVELHITVNDPMKSASNGLLQRDTYSPGPKRTDYWKLERPIPTYLITMVVGMFDYWVDEGRPIVDYRTLGGWIEHAKHSLRHTRKMIEVFEKITGVPYPYERYGQVFVWDFIFGGMENASMTTLNMRALYGPGVEPNYSSESLVAHELAHMWYGDLITCRTWHHIWLNEGFATYFADLWFESEYGRDDFRVRRWRQTTNYMDGTPEPEKLGLERDPRGDRPLELFGGKQYDRGAAILHQLRLELGDKTFFAAIRDYTEKHQDTGAVTNDFRRAAERQAGRDMSWFFDQWVYGAGYPRLDVDWRYEEAQKQVLVTVRQSQPEAGGQGRFQLTLPVAVMLDHAVVRGYRLVKQEKHEFVFPCPAPPRAVRVNEGGWLLARVDVNQSFEAWRHQALEDEDVIGRLVAVDKLTTFGRRGAETISEVLGRDPHWAVREAAALALGAFPGSGTAGEALHKAAVDADSRVRQAAFDSIGGRRAETDGRFLIEALAKEKHPFVRSQIGQAIGSLHLPQAFDILAKMLDESSHREIIRHGALIGLQSLGDPRAVELAWPFLDYKWGHGAQSKMRHAALDLILALDPESRATRAQVVKLLADPYFRMREWAAKACADFEIREAIPALKKNREKDRHWGARRAAKQALEKLTKK